jgi:hypothetical protein
MGVITRDALNAGILTEFWQAYRQNETKAKEFFKHFCLFTNAKGRTNTQVYPTSMPHLRYFAPGEPVPEDGYGEESFTYTTYDFGLKVKWKQRDRLDQFVDVIQPRGTPAGLATATLHSRILAQLIKQEENSDLLPSISTLKAPDGVAPFSTVDGNGGYRYGVENGNLQPLTDIDTVAGIQTDFFAGLSAFGRYLHTNLVTRIYDGIDLKRFLIVYPPEKVEPFTLFFKQKLQEGSNGSKSNIIADGGFDLELFGWPELTGEDSWFLVCKDAPVMPFITSETTPIEVDTYDAKNSDKGRDIREEGVVITRRDKWGIGPCFGMIKFA